MDTSPSTPLPSPGRLFRDRRATPRPEPGAALSAEADLPWPAALRRHWPEFAIEGGFLALFVLAAGLASAWLQADAPDAHQQPWRHALAGIVGGLVLIGLIQSPWGRRSGSHLNPAITLAYLRLGKIGRPDALFYLLAQAAGAIVAVAVLRSGLLVPAASAPALTWTSADTGSPWGSVGAELVLSAGAMLTILYTSNHERWFRWTGVLYGLLVMLLMASAAPLAGLGMNVARLLAVDLFADPAVAPWVNLLPPLLGMQLAVELYRRVTGRRQVLCAKLAHNTHGRCIFRCHHPWQARANAMAAIRRRAPASRRH